MFCALLFFVLVASVTSNPTSLSPKDHYDLSGPEVFPEPENNSTLWRHVSLDVDITVDMASLLGEPSSLVDSEDIVFEESSGLFSCSYQLMVATGIMVLLAALVTVEVYALYLKRLRMREGDVVHVKNTV